MNNRLWLIPLVSLALIGCVLATPRPTVAPPATPVPVATATPSPSAPAPTVPAATPSPTASPQTTLALPWGWDDLSPHRQAMLPAFSGDVDRFADATRYAIDVDIDPEKGIFQGTALVRYTNHESESLSEIVFRLLPNTPGYGGAVSVSYVTVNRQETRVSTELAESVLTVPLANALAPGGSVEIGLTFEGTVLTDGSAGYAQYGYIDEVLALPNFYPMIPVYDDEGWNVELAPTYGDATFTDTALYALRITLPSKMKLAVSGVIVDQKAEGDGKTTYLVASGPMRDVNLVASADYRTVQEKVGDVLVTSYFLPGDRAGGKRVLDYTVRSLEIYRDLIGPYPFTELEVVATPTEAGGIEYPGLIVVAARLYQEEGGFFEFATVHEVAHQWWYSLVGNDQLDEPWLDEALTQYTSLLYFEKRYGKDVMQGIAEGTFRPTYKQLQDDDQDMPIGLPVAAYSLELYGPVVYYKGPLFFLEMREQLGDDVLNRILRTYFEQYRYGVAYPQDLMTIAEQVSGQDLDPLYEKWILEPKQ